MKIAASMTAPRCDGSPYYGNGCRNAATWVVRVGERQADGQLTCATHLNQACEAMLAAEHRSGAVLTVRRAATG